MIDSYDTFSSSNGYRHGSHVASSNSSFSSLQLKDKERQVIKDKFKVS